MIPPTFRIGTWNTEWARRNSARGTRVRDALATSDCDVLCVTEGFAGILPDGGHVIEADPDYGYPIHEGRRKVLLWSRRPWTDVDALGSEELPSGRFVAGVTETPVGPLTVVGVCIPWSGAHVTGGTKDRERWEDHQAWLAGFERLPYRSADSRTVVLGDFNQRIPRKYTPTKAHEALLRAFEGFEIATEGELPGAPGLAIDHLAHTPDLTRGAIGIWPRRSMDDEPMSDHFGVWCDFKLEADRSR